MVGELTGRQRSEEFYDHWYANRVDPVTVPAEDDFVYGHILRTIKKYVVPGSRALDYGCGDGIVALFAAQNGCTAVGLDIAPAAIARAQAYADAHLPGAAHFELGDFKNASSMRPFDIAWAIEVIEHVHEDGVLVRWLASQLAPGGICLLTTRLSTDPFHRLRKRLHGRDWADENDGHLRRYDIGSIQALVQSADMRLIEMFTAEGAVRFACYKYKLGSRIWRLCRMWRPMLSVLDRLDRLCVRWWGPSQVIVVGQR